MHTAVSGRRSILTGAGSVSVVSDSHLGWESSPQQSISLHPHPQHSDHENVPADVSTAPTTAAAAEPRPGCCSTRWEIKPLVVRLQAKMPLLIRWDSAFQWPGQIWISVLAPSQSPVADQRSSQAWARCLALLPMTRRRPYALAYPHGVPGAEPGVQGRATQPPILLG
ncbi:uncharacterized protein LOC135090754 isoform X4 [Scylla paramamosain]|uniref:uncharacterized protein LOC135090754 isoform X4 n=1 Tax=Scylla paramamosain TaxID=85552 RepID=UPI0030831A3E